MYKIFIDGKEGTTGLRIYDRLAERSDIEFLTLSDELRKDSAARAEKINQSDITFLCLPDDAAREAVAMAQPDVRIIDASTAHRTDPNWVYGFPELSDKHFEEIKSARLVTVPGCHASGFIALVHPLVAVGMLPKDYPLTCTSLTGYSGGGKKMIADYETEDRDSELSSPRPYGLTQMHKHLPEMKHSSGIDRDPVFIPIVDDYYSGMLVIVPIFTKMLNGSPTPQDIVDVYKKAYGGKPFLSVLPFGADGAAFIGSNNLSDIDSMEIIVSGNDDRVTLMSRFDNLGKGASGAAVQCMNIMLGLDETTGLQLK